MLLNAMNDYLLLHNAVLSPIIFFTKELNLSFLFGSLQSDQLKLAYKEIKINVGTPANK